MAVFSVAALTAWSSPLRAGAPGVHAVVDMPAEDVPIAAETETPPAPRSLGMANRFLAGVNVHDLGVLPEGEAAAADTRAAALHGALEPGPARLGLVRTIPFAPLSPLNEDLMHTELEDGRLLGTMSVRSPGAFGVRLHFTEFDAGDGSLLVYADDGNGLVVHGPYTGWGPQGNGDFWTPSLPGETVFIETVGVEPPHFALGEIVHFDRHPGGAPSDAAAAQGGPLSCHEDVMCHSVSTSARNATGQMNYIKNGSSFVCTGTMLNDQDPETTVPYFITAQHCLNTQAQVNTLEVVWLYQRSSCNGTLPNYFSLPRSTGGTLVTQNSGNDMLFLRLAGAVPGGVSLAGWTTALPGTAYGIHHPAGSWKRYVHWQSSGLCPGCEFCGASSDFEYYNRDVGLTEPGSSGSGIFNSSGQLFGQLYGHCCVTLDCAGETLNCSNQDEFNYFYGEFETTHPLISYWLSVGGTFHVNAAWPFNGNGTPASPFKTITSAHANAWNGLRFKIQAGTYPGAHTITKQVTLVANGGTVVIGG